MWKEKTCSSVCDAGLQKHFTVWTFIFIAVEISMICGIEGWAGVIDMSYGDTNCNLHGSDRVMHRNPNDLESIIGKYTFIQSHQRPKFSPETPSCPF